MKALKVRASWIGGTLYDWLKLLPEAIRLLNENSSARDGLPPYEWLAAETVQTISTAVDCQRKLDGKTLMLKTAHALVAEHGEIKLELIWKFPPCWLDFTVPEDAVEAVGENCHQQFYSIVDPGCCNPNLPGTVCPPCCSGVIVMR